MAGASEAGPGSAIVVLGAAVRPNGSPSPALTGRIAEAARQARRWPDLPIIASGGIGRYPPAEAVVIRDGLIALATDPTRILLETESRTTLENGRNSIALMRSHGLTHALIVTDRRHLPRALMTFRKLGMPATGCPARPGALPLRKRLVALAREAAALPVYWLRLTLRR